MLFNLGTTFPGEASRKVPQGYLLASEIVFTVTGDMGHDYGTISIHGELELNVILAYYMAKLEEFKVPEPSVRFRKLAVWSKSWTLPTVRI